ncbi:MAG TPA: hypothetical protein VHJ18_25905 [Streptosporangiaceae bacterium]|jgi:hypothetical protein|nr:hypothetical protein [Streptosporangiaceae bacterium]
MPAGKDRPPAFELGAAADAKHITFLVQGRTRTHSEGVAPVYHIGQRSGPQDRVRQGGRSTDAHATIRIAAWLADADGSSES